LIDKLYSCSNDTTLISKIGPKLQACSSNLKDAWNIEINTLHEKDYIGEKHTFNYAKISPAFDDKSL